MKRFRFRLSSVENLRGAELDALRQQLAEAQELLRRAELRLAALKRAIEESHAEMGRLRSEKADPAILLSMESYGTLLREQVQRQQREIEDCSRRFEELREQLAEKHREKKVLETYREKLKGEHEQRLALETQNELDETAAKLFLRAV